MIQLIESRTFPWLLKASSSNGRAVDSKSIGWGFESLLACKNIQENGEIMGKDDATWLKIAYVMFALLVGFVGLKAIDTVGIQTGWGQKFTWFPVVSMAGAVVTGILGTWILSKDKERHDYFLAAIGELRRVSWPSAQDTRRMTMVVCVVVGIFGVILAIFDFLWAQVLKVLLS